MSVFVCDECDHIANTATDGYWEQLAEQRDVKREERRYLCSLCRTGKWHGVFPRTKWDGKRPMWNRRVNSG